MDWNRLPLARGTVDRAADRRTDPALLDDLLRAAGTRVVLVHEGRLAVDGGEEPVLDLTAASDLPAAAVGPGAEVLRVFLGLLDGAEVVGLVLPDQPSPEVDLEGVAAVDDLPGLVRSRRWASLRDVGHALPDAHAALAAAVIGLAAWHERHPRCPRCGAWTEPASSGWTRRCTQDGSEHYPRTDPAVIMAVVDADDRILLGHAPHWPPRRYSTLAGYVEPGESLEAAVRREVGEEVGVEIGAVEYRGSQPWPFPASLMLAFVARARTTHVVVDADEITDARWFTRDELGRAVEAQEVLLPMRTSVSRALIEEWFGGPLA